MGAAVDGQRMPITTLSSTEFFLLLATHMLRVINYAKDQELDRKPIP